MFDEFQKKSDYSKFRKFKQKSFLSGVIKLYNRFGISIITVKGNDGAEAENCVLNPLSDFQIIYGRGLESCRRCMFTFTGERLGYLVSTKAGRSALFASTPASLFT